MSKFTHEQLEKMLDNYDIYSQNRIIIRQLLNENKLMREALEWISNNVGHNPPCTGRQLEMSCDAGCEGPIKAREALAAVEGKVMGKESNSHNGQHKDITSDIHSSAEIVFDVPAFEISGSYNVQIKDDCEKGEE